MPLASTQSVPTGSRLSTLSQPPYLDPSRLTTTNVGFQEQQQQAMYSDRFAGLTASRRHSHVGYSDPKNGVASLQTHDTLSLLHQLRRLELCSHVAWVIPIFIAVFALAAVLQAGSCLGDEMCQSA